MWSSNRAVQRWRNLLPGRRATRVGCWFQAPTTRPGRTRGRTRVRRSRRSTGRVERKRRAERWKRSRRRKRRPMACPQLQLTSEVFGLAHEYAIVGSTVVRGQWVVLAKLDGAEQSTNVTGVTVRVTESSAEGTIKVAVTIGAGDKTVQFPWSGASVGLVASRFRTADFLVVRYVAGSTGGAHTWTFAVFDLRASAATSTAPNPIVLGPFDLPA